jgi:hypothetical protein
MPEYTLNAPNAAACATPVKVLGTDALGALGSFNPEAFKSYTVYAGEVRDEVIPRPLGAAAGTAIPLDTRGSWSITNPSTCREMLVTVNFSGIEVYLVSDATFSVQHGTVLFTGTGAKTTFGFGQLLIAQSVVPGQAFSLNSLTRGAGFNEVIAPGATFTVTLVEGISIGADIPNPSPTILWESQGFTITVVGVSI